MLPALTFGQETDTSNLVDPNTYLSRARAAMTPVPATPVNPTLDTSTSSTGQPSYIQQRQKSLFDQLMNSGILGKMGVNLGSPTTATTPNDASNIPTNAMLNTGDTPTGSIDRTADAIRPAPSVNPNGGRMMNPNIYQQLPRNIPFMYNRQPSFGGFPSRGFGGFGGFGGYGGMMGMGLGGGFGMGYPQMGGYGYGFGQGMGGFSRPNYGGYGGFGNPYGGYGGFSNPMMGMGLGSMGGMLGGLGGYTAGGSQSQPMNQFQDMRSMTAQQQPAMNSFQPMQSAQQQANPYQQQYQQAFY